MDYRKWASFALGGVLAGVLAGCNLGGRSGHGHIRRVDERAGSYRGVALGDSAAEAINVLGSPVERESPDTPATPIGSDFSTGTPLIQRNPPGYRTKPHLLRYQDVALLYAPTVAGIYNIVIDDPNAVTSKMVHVGDPMARAREAYPSLRCAKAKVSGEGSHPAWCTGKVAARRYLWFGGDPIRVIALGETPMA